MKVSSDSADQSNKALIYSGFVFCSILALTPLIGMVTPRFLAFFPLLLMLTGLCSFNRAVRSRLSETLKTYGIPFVVFFVLAQLSSLWAIDQEETLERTIKLLPLILPVLFLPAIVTRFPKFITRKYIFLFFTALAAATILASIELYFDGPLYQLIRGKREDAVFNLSQLNRGITTLVLTFLIAIAFLLSPPLRNFKKTVFFPVLAILFLLVLYKTDSQSAQLAFGVGIFFMFAFPYRRKAAWAVLGILIAVLIISAPWLVQFMFKELAGDVQSVNWLQNAYAADRLEIWDSVARYILQNPLYGFGLEATRAVEAFDTAQIYRKSVTVLHPHNFALQLWIEFGVIGAVLGSTFIGFILYRLSKWPIVEARLALPVMMAFLSVCATGYGLWQGWWVGLSVVLLSSILMLKEGLALFYDRRA